MQPWLEWVSLPHPYVIYKFPQSLLDCVLFSRLASKGASLSIIPTPKRQKLDHKKKIYKSKSWKGWSDDKTTSWHSYNPLKDWRGLRNCPSYINSSLPLNKAHWLISCLPRLESISFTFRYTEDCPSRNCPTVQLGMPGVPDQLLLDTGRLFEVVS